MRVQSFTTKNGETVELGDFTVLVGPNNTGKSQTLDDIRLEIRNDNGSTIIDELTVELPDQFDELKTGVKRATDQHDHEVLRGIGSNLLDREVNRASLERLEEQFQRGNHQPILNTFGSFKVAHLDTSSRLQVAESGPAHNMHEEAPSNLLQALFEAGPEVDEELRSAFQNVFSRPDEPRDIAFDISGMTELCLRVAEEFENIPSNPRKAVGVMEEYRILDEEGDGYRSFVGVVLSLLLSQNRVVLLDEPEAFLHPAQARELGRWVANHSSDTAGQIVIATHDADFIAGILSEGTEVDIYRLNRREDHTVYNQISSDITEKLANDPLLSSQRVLEAIFHEGVIVCEGGSDKAVYRSIAVNEIENDQLLFVNAHGKHSIKDITTVLNEANIPVATITDIDILRNHHNLRYLLESLADGDFNDILEIRSDIEQAIQGISDEEVIEQMIPEVEQFLEQLENGEHTLSGADAAVGRLSSGFSEWKEVKELGVDGIPREKLEEEDHPEELIKEAKQHGLFIVPVGELEGWMDLGRSRKSTWVVKALEVIGTTDRDGDDEYAYSDLTRFVEDIERYLADEYSQLIRAQSD
ncbi:MULTISPECIES: ATP-dependent nuclease [Halorussus]|uniref:ATP-dependent nuclease n=1 Tax=Halorussus TaxID=1070314 RepID=UPI0020A163CB|nr:ATP-binding protein [Halorussus vallis]USZ77199.1 ATP-binding protein [Halorussus vallis]